MDSNTRIEIVCDELYKVGSSDNNYAYAWEYSDGSPFVTNNVGIKLKDKTGEVFNSSILSFEGYSSRDGNSYIIDNDKLFIIAGKYLTCLTLDDLQLQWKTQCDASALFQVFKLEKRYLVHGELEICCVDEKGKVIWTFAGKDIFALPDGGIAIEIRDHKILLLDWEKNSYVLDFNGEQEIEIS